MTRDLMRPTAVNRFLFRFFLILAIAITVLGVALISVTPLILLIGLGWLVTAFGLGAVFRWLRRRVDRREALKHEGAPGEATVLEATRTHTKIGGSEGVGGTYVQKMRLRIEVDGIEPYEIEKRVTPRLGPSWLQPGQTWPVYVDRTDRENIMVDWDAMQASEQTVEIRPGITIHSQGQPDVRRSPDGRRIVFDLLRGRGVTIQGTHTTPPAPDQDERTAGDRMLELQRLKNAGHISDEEFELQKARIVDSI